MAEDVYLNINISVYDQVRRLFSLSEDDLHFSVIPEVLETYLYLKYIKNKEEYSLFSIIDKLESLYLILPIDEMYNVTPLMDLLYKEFDSLSDDELFIIFKEIIWYLKEIKRYELNYYKHYNDYQIIDLSPNQIEFYVEKERLKYIDFNELNKKWDEEIIQVSQEDILRKCKNRLIDCLSDSRTLKTREQIENYVGHKNILYKIIKPDIALDYKGLYFYSDYLDFTKSEISTIHEVVQNSLKEDGVTHVDEIYENLRSIMSDQLDHNYIYTSYALFSVLSYLFDANYIFDRPYLINKEIDIKEKENIISVYLYQNIRTDITKLSSYIAEKKVNVPSFLNLVDSLNNLVCFENKNVLIRWDGFEINRKDIHEIEKLIYDEIYSKSFKPIVDLECTYWFPNIDLDWDEWFIYSILKKYSTILFVQPSHSQFKYATPVVSIYPDLSMNELSNINELVKGHTITKNSCMDLDDIEIENIDELLEEIEK